MPRNAAESAQSEPAALRFGPFLIDIDTRQLLRDGTEIRLSPKAFELLVTLIANRPKVLSKAVLQQNLWPDSFVVEANLSNLVAEIRHVLDDEPRAPRYVRTAHGFGYAFCGDATSLPRAGKRPSDQPVCWLDWDRRQFPLALGEHVIGRDSDVDVRLDATTVSRRHARLVVTPASIVLEDFGSKNGTFRRGERITTPVQLADGDQIGIGSLLMTFHRRSDRTSTETQKRLRD